MSRRIIIPIVFFSMLLNTVEINETTPPTIQQNKIETSQKKTSRQNKVINQKKTDEYKVLYNLIKTFKPDINDDKAKLYASVIYFKSKEYDVDPYWILAMIWQESSLNHKAKSSVGAVGLMQLMPSTAKSIGVSRNDLYNPKVNISTGIKYFAYLKQYYKGDIKKATIAYNQGITRVNSGKYNSKYYYKVRKHYKEIQKRSVGYDILQERYY